MIFESFKLICISDFSDSDMFEIWKTLDILLGQQNEVGNFPPNNLGTWYDLVHWCHGAGGAVLTFLQAWEFYNDIKYLKAAEKAAECVWKFGILRKGNSVCHGVVGNTYPFFQMYQYSNDI